MGIKAAIVLLCFVCIQCTLKHVYLEQLHFNKDETIESSNLYRINRFFQQVKNKPDEGEDYYFIILGDSRNLVRTYDLNPFNQVVKHIFFLRDKTTGEPIFHKIRFMIHMGDFVYNGAERVQWLNLKKAFSEKDYVENSYAYLKTFTASKPLFPVLGNHEIMTFGLRIPSSAKGFDKSKKGVKHFKEFFNWDGFIANPSIITPIPAEWQKEAFHALLAKLRNDEDREKLKKHYVLMKDNFYRLKIFQDIIAKYKTKKESPAELKENFLDGDKKKETIADLQGVYTALGYHTMPVLSSDNMICYAFEVDDLVFLVLDSMARGMHYKNFEKLKRFLFGKSNRHRLHLFSKSDLNGQYEFFKAVFNDAGKRGKILVPVWHHSPLNGHTMIDAPGVGFNLKLMLGLKLLKPNKQEDTDEERGETFLDDIIFAAPDGSNRVPRITYVFTSCVHSFETFSLISSYNGKEINKIKWFITGGGGAELSKKFHYERLERSIREYNQRWTDSDYPGRNIEITGHKVTRKYNFLVVRVKQGKIHEVYPYFMEKDQIIIKPSPFFRNIRFKWPVFSEPLSLGWVMGLDLVRVGFERASRYLYFVTWEPGLELGLLSADIEGDAGTCGILTFSPGKFTFNLPKHRFTLTLLGYTKFFGVPGSSKEYLTFGVESPVFHNLFGTAKRWSLAFNWYVLVNEKEKVGASFGDDIKFSLALSYKF